MLKTFVACVLLGFTCLAGAQVFKCVEDKTRQITFSDRGCPRSAAGEYVDVRPTNQFEGGHLRDYAAQDRAAEAQRAYERAREAEQERSAARAAPASSPMADACAAAMKGRLDSRAARNRAAVLCGQPQTIDPPAPVPQPQAGPSHMSKCDGGGCWGYDGSRYTRKGEVFFGTDGRSCRLRHGQMVCN